MKRVSFWARDHVFIARILIICIKLMLAAMAYFVGMALFRMGVVLPAGTIYITAFLALIFVLAVYPSQKKNAFSKNAVYIRQKSCDLILGAGSFLVIASAVNNGDVSGSYSRAYGAEVIKRHPSASEILNSLSTRDRSSLNRMEKRILKKEFYRQLKLYTLNKVSGNKQKADDAGGIILVIIGALGLLFLLGALTCSLSCNGSEGAAVIIGLLGLIGIVWGAVVLINRIVREPKKSD